MGIYCINALLSIAEIALSDVARSLSRQVVSKIETQRETSHVPPIVLWTESTDVRM